MGEHLLTEDQCAKARKLAEQMYTVKGELANRNLKVSATFNDKRINKWKTDTDIGRGMTEAMDINQQNIDKLVNYLQKVWSDTIRLIADSERNNAR